MIQYEDQGPGARGSHRPFIGASDHQWTGREVQGASTAPQLNCQEATSVEVTLPCWVEGSTPPSVMQIDSPHGPEHQEETITPQGVHGPEACLCRESVGCCHPAKGPRPITEECCTC